MKRRKGNPVLQKQLFRSPHKIAEGGPFSILTPNVAPSDFLSYEKRAENELFWGLLPQIYTAMCSFSLFLPSQQLHVQSY